MTAKGVILFTAAVGALLLCSCAKNEDTSSLTESQQEQSDFPRCIVGEWKCRETPLDNSELYSGYLSLIIRSDGNYLMYDAEAGNPCLKGDIETFLEEDNEEELAGYTEEDKKIAEDYNNQMLYDRNKNMAKAAEDLMSQGKNVFLP